MTWARRRPSVSRWSRPWRSPRALPLRFGQGRWAVSLAAEKNWEAPANAKKSQALLGLRYEVPVSDSITVPFSLKWSNRNELLQDESEVVGHVGFSINFDSLLARD